MNRFLCILMNILLMSAICSCSRKVYVPVDSSHIRESIRADTVFKVLQRVDSIVCRDSVNTFVSGDTVLKEIIRWRVRDRLRVDTVLRFHAVEFRDTIRTPVPYPVEKMVYIRSPVSGWDSFRQRSFWPLVLIVTGFTAYAFRKPLLRLLCKLRL